VYRWRPSSEQSPSRSPPTTRADWASCRRRPPDEAEKLLAGGVLSVKLRLGNPNLEQDLAVPRAVRKRLPDAVELPVDYNQVLTVAEAIRRGRALEGEGVAWLE